MELFKLLGTIAINGDSAKKEIDETTGKAQKAEGSMTSTFKKIGAAVTTYFAIDKVVEFGKACVESAATVQAAEAQFEAAFGDLQNEAKKSLSSVSQDTGILFDRLKTIGTKAFSQFKGAGLDAATSLEKMDTYSRLAADGAAYYDMSLEEVDELMRSFIRGNTEAGDRIGLFTSETQRNQAALDKLGKKYIDCSEAEKQMIMLDIAQSIYDASGATGQAAREADGYENVVGNLKESWKQFMAALGEPALKLVIPIIQKITEILTALPDGLYNIGQAFQNDTAISSFAQKAVTAFESLKSKGQEAFQKVDAALSPAKEAFSGFFATIMPVIEQAIPVIQRMAERWIESFSNIITAISPLLSAIGNLFSFISNIVGMVFALLNGDWSSAWEFARAAVQNAISAVQNILQALSNFINLIFTTIINSIVAAWNAIITTVVNACTNMVNNVKTGFQNMVNGIREKLSYAKDTVVSGLQGALDYIASLPGKFLQWGKDIIQQFIDGIKEKIDSGVETIKNFADQLVNKFKEILGIQSPSTVFKDIGKNILQGLINGLNADSLLSFANNMLDQLKDAFSNGLGDIGKLFSAMGNGAASLFQKLGINIGGGGMVGSNGLIWPSDTGTNALTSYFGYRNDTGGVGSSYHQGVDIGAPDGSPIYASGYGTVSIAGWYGGYGNAVKIGHGGGLETLYGHMSAVAVAPGQTVVPGQVIGYVGSTGNSTGPHIHYSILVDGQQVDPGMFFGFEDGAIVSKPTAGVFAEAGKEALIPLSVPKRRQGLALWRESGKELGAFDDTSSIQGLLQDIKTLLTVIAEKKQIVVLDGKIVGELVDEILGAYL
ncbi:MAG: hypothetical protein EUB_03641 [Eubacterium sp.]|uniref:peptidoglycan DD-metalloendopeptidase family protein n=1 Tax=Eubacterium sp. TaxID=142586 RepID=UPI0030465E7B